MCKDWGSTGWIYDTEAIDGEINTWNDFIAAAQGPASGKTSVLDAPADLCGIYFWANGIDWTTEDQADLDACQEFTVNELAPHIKAFDSYPGIALTQGNYVLSQAWNGDARQGLIAVQDKDPERYKWGLGAPKTELWMDNWCILAEAENVNAAYAWINFILQPDDLPEGPRVPRLQHRHQGRAGVGGEAPTSPTSTWCSSTRRRSPRSRPAP